MMPVEGERAQHQDDAGATPKKANQEALLDTFPASDPVAQRVELGARAVPLAEDEVDVAPPADAVPHLFAFPSREKAKLAQEGAVRDLPLDRRFTALDGDENGATLRLHVREQDGNRLAEIMERAGGEKR